MNRASRLSNSRAVSSRAASAWRQLANAITQKTNKAPALKSEKRYYPKSAMNLSKTEIYVRKWTISF